MAAAASASVMRSGWLKKESEAKPGSLAKRWVVLDADLQLLCYKDTACDDLRCTIRCDGPGVRVSIVNGSYIQIDACVQNGQPLSSVTLKAETAAIALEWATRLSPLVLSDDYAHTQPGSSIEVNAAASEGSVRIEVLDEHGYRLKGFTKADAAPLESDALQHVATWKEKKTGDLSGGVCSLRVHLTGDATVYALNIRPATN